MAETLTSAEAAALANVGPTAIKRWADAGILPCIRTAGGHRRFRREDVQRLMRSGVPASSDQWNEWIDVLVSRSDPHEIQGRLLEERARRGSWHGAADALGGLLVAIGERWRAGRLTVVEEHLASAGLERALAAVAAGIAVSPGAPRCLLAPAEGEEHTLGLSLVEVCVREAGWKAEWTGRRTRTGDVIERLHRSGIHMVAVSAASSATDTGALGRAAEQLGHACSRAGVSLVLGGQGSWPETPAYGVRLHSVLAFYDYAVERRSACQA
jgi:excisionase family DNA binding protein